MRRWIDPAEVSVSNELLELIEGNRIAARMLFRRCGNDLQAAREFLDSEVYFDRDHGKIPGMDEAVERLRLSLDQKEHILVWGDFDVDGQTATALLVETLKDLGGKVSYHIPVRAKESHGVGIHALKGLLDGNDDPPRLILTCDTGINAFEAADYLHNRAVDLIITDHHELPVVDPFDDRGVLAGREKRLPRAIAIVSPRMLPQGHAMEDLPGVGVAYKTAEALSSRVGNSELAHRHLDLVALGIVADVARLKGETRALLQRGLNLLRTQERLGIRAIVERAEANPTQMNEEFIAFVLAPRLNALGRLGDANPAVELLTTQDFSRARLLALELESLNIKRQLLSKQVLDAARRQIEQEAQHRNASVIVLFHPSWPAGVLGIAASKLAEIYGKPAILINSPPGELARGSARSVEGIDITSAIRSQEALLEGFGGHPMAAGFAIERDKIPQFQKGLERVIAAQAAAMPAHTDELNIDAYIDWSELTLEFATVLEKLAPFGNGNRAPILATRGLHLTRQASLGRKQEHLQMVLEDENGIAQKVIWWGAGDLVEKRKFPQGRLNLAYRVRTTSYRGEPELSIIFEDFQPEEEIIINTRPKENSEFIDLRSSTQPFTRLIRLLEDVTASYNYNFGDLQILAEGPARLDLFNKFNDIGKISFQSLLRYRVELQKSKILVIWTIPPGIAEYHMALQLAEAKQVVVFGIDPEIDRAQEFVDRLAGLVKFRLEQAETKISLEELASALGHTMATTRLGLRWLEAKGYINPIRSKKEIESAAEEIIEYELVPKSERSADLQKEKNTMGQITQLLRETAAFRRFFLTTDLDHISSFGDY